MGKIRRGFFEYISLKKSSSSCFVNPKDLRRNTDSYFQTPSSSCRALEYLTELFSLALEIWGRLLQRRSTSKVGCLLKEGIASSSRVATAPIFKPSLPAYDIASRRIHKR